MRHALVHDRRDERIARSRFDGVEELEAADLQVHLSELLELEIGLFEECARVVCAVAVGRVVRAAKTELAERCGRHYVCRQREDSDGFALDEAVDLRAFLPEGDAHLGVAEAVVAVSGIPLEPVLHLRARTPVHGYIERAELG